MAVQPNDVFTAAEIAKASGRDAAAIRKLIDRLKKEGQIPEEARAYTYSQVKLILTTKPKKRGVDPVRVDKLKIQLINDGMARK